LTPCACRRRRQRNSGLPNFPGGVSATGRHGPTGQQPGPNWCGYRNKRCFLGGAFDLRHKRKRSDPAARLLEHDPQTSPVGPNHPTALLRDAKQQFKSIGHFGLRVYLEACATGRIVNNVAINHGSFRANDYFGLRTPARRANASKVSRIHYRPLPLIRISSDRLTDYPENFVSVYGYRNTSCGGQQGTSQQTSFEVRRCRWSAGSRADSQPKVSQAQLCNGTADKVIRGHSAARRPGWPATQSPSNGRRRVAVD
jgi:hypothetical protein